MNPFILLTILLLVSFEITKIIMLNIIKNEVESLKFHHVITKKEPITYGPRVPMQTVLKPNVYECAEILKEHCKKKEMCCLCPLYIDGFCAIATYLPIQWEPEKWKEMQK